MVTARLPLAALRKRQIAALAWTWMFMLGFATLFLGTFVIAFMASLKEDPLESPFRFLFPQIMPSARPVIPQATGLPMARRMGFTSQLR